MAKSHSKKRNTSLLYEVLILELTKAVLNNDASRKEVITDLLKDHFSRGSILSKELECYKALYQENLDLDPYTCEKMLIESKRAYASLDLNKIFKAQSSLINDINVKLSKEVYENFVPNYKHLATISSILNPNTPVGKKVLYEKKIIEQVKNSKVPEALQPVGNLLYKTFVKKFNEIYEAKLLTEQKTLIKYFVESGVNGDQVDLKVFLNSELPRLQTELFRLAKLPLVRENKDFRDKIEKIIETMDKDFPNRPVDSQFILDVLKIQHVVNETNKIAKET